MKGRREISEADWNKEGENLFGKNMMDWKFVCPSCGYVASIQDWKNVGAREGHVAYSCVGRWMDNPNTMFKKKNGGPCDYAGGGLFALNPVQVMRTDGTVRQTFEFAKGGKTCKQDG
jgi:hypothetical protein